MWICYVDMLCGYVMWICYVDTVCIIQMPDRMANRLTDKMPEQVPDRMPERMSENVRIYICHIYTLPAGMSETMSELCVTVGITRSKVMCAIYTAIQVCLKIDTPVPLVKQPLTWGVPIIFGKKMGFPSTRLSFDALRRRKRRKRQNAPVATQGPSRPLGTAPSSHRC